MGRLLPPTATESASYEAALRVIADKEGLPKRDVVRFEDGSLPVFALGKLVVKLYPPAHRSAHTNEQTTLELLHGRLPIPTPEVVASGELETWRYLIMTRMEGRPLRRWSVLGESDLEQIVGEVGAAIASLHALDMDACSDVDWSNRVATRRTECVARQLRLGLGEQWAAQIDPFLDSVADELPTHGPSGLLHTEIMREHVFVRADAGSYALSGLIDFEPSEVGPTEYEFSSVGLFLTEGNANLWKAFLDGYGVPPSARDEAFSRRCLAWGLLHRYANLAWWLTRLPEPPTHPSLETLALYWFGNPGRQR